MERISLSIEGMSCAHCVRAVDEALEGLEGVSVEKVEVGTALLGYDPAVTSPDQISAVILDQGYEIAKVESL